MAKFFEIIRPDHNFEFVGRQRLFLGLSGFFVLLSILMLDIWLSTYLPRALAQPEPVRERVLIGL